MDGAPEQRPGSRAVCVRAPWAHFLHPRDARPGPTRPGQALPSPTMSRLAVPRRVGVSGVQGLPKDPHGTKKGNWGSWRRPCWSAPEPGAVCCGALRRGATSPHPKPHARALTAVEPFFTASCAYSTWKRCPSGEKTVIARS